jgi:hypothetical protein
MLNHTINLDFSNNIYGFNNMEAIPKFDIKSEIWHQHKTDYMVKRVFKISVLKIFKISVLKIFKNFKKLLSIVAYTWWF